MPNQPAFLSKSVDFHHTSSQAIKTLFPVFRYMSLFSAIHSTSRSHQTHTSIQNLMSSCTPTHSPAPASTNSDQILKIVCFSLPLPNRFGKKKLKVTIALFSTFDFHFRLLQFYIPIFCHQSIQFKFLATRWNPRFSHDIPFCMIRPYFPLRFQP